jgi:hypothetical protein
VACRALYHQLTAETLSDADPSFPHQLAVDAYAAQHPGASSKPITTAFALIGLHLVCERGFTGRQVQSAHMQLARRRQEWPRFQSPARRGAVTVADVLAAGGDKRNEALSRWVRSVWAAWESEHGRVAALVRERLYRR